MARILGIDYGEKRMGISISDERRKIALPLETICGEDEIFLQRVGMLIAQHNICEIVIGLPLNLSGDESPMSVKVRDFARRIGSFGVRISFVDERLTTVEAERALRELGTEPSKNRERLDIIAATLILQTYLDTVNISENEPEDKSQ